MNSRRGGRSRGAVSSKEGSRLLTAEPGEVREGATLRWRDHAASSTWRISRLTRLELGGLVSSNGTAASNSFLSEVGGSAHEPGLPSLVRR